MVLLKNKTKTKSIQLEIKVGEFKSKITLYAGVENGLLIARISDFFSQRQKEIFSVGLSHSYRICLYIIRTLNVADPSGFVAYLISVYVGKEIIDYIYNVNIPIEVNLLSIHKTDVFLKKASKTALKKASKKYKSKPENYVKKRKKPKYKFHRW